MDLEKKNLEKKLAEVAARLRGGYCYLYGYREVTGRFRENFREVTGRFRKVSGGFKRLQIDCKIIKQNF